MNKSYQNNGCFSLILFVLLIVESEREVELKICHMHARDLIRRCAC
jgi:hypothetical protein